MIRGTRAAQRLFQSNRREQRGRQRDVAAQEASGQRARHAALACCSAAASMQPCQTPQLIHAGRVLRVSLLPIDTQNQSTAPAAHVARCRRSACPG